MHWSNYKFDSDGFGFVSKALISPEWELTTTLSGCSLSKVTGCESRRLEQTLSDSPNNRASVLFSGSWQEIQTLFEHFDYKEFLQLCCVLRQIFTDISNSEGWKVYLTDLLWTINPPTGKILAVDCNSPLMFALIELHIVAEDDTYTHNTVILKNVVMIICQLILIAFVNLFFYLPGVVVVLCTTCVWFDGCWWVSNTCLRILFV